MEKFKVVKQGMKLSTELFTSHGGFSLFLVTPTRVNWNSPGRNSCLPCALVFVNRNSWSFTLLFRLQATTIAVWAVSTLTTAVHTGTVCTQNICSRDPGSSTHGLVCAPVSTPSRNLKTSSGSPSFPWGYCSPVISDLSCCPHGAICAPWIQMVSASPLGVYRGNCSHRHAERGGFPEGLGQARPDAASSSGGPITGAQQVLCLCGCCHCPFRLSTFFTGADS